jgi:hypothetical protein
MKVSGTPLAIVIAGALLAVAVVFHATRPQYALESGVTGVLGDDRRDQVLRLNVRTGKAELCALADPKSSKLHGHCGPFLPPAE